MRIFRHLFLNDSDYRYGSSPFTSMTTNAAKMLVVLAFFFIGIGILIIMFPEVLAYFVALLFFAAAFACFSWAWKIFRAGKNRQVDNMIHIDVDDV